MAIWLRRATPDSPGNVGTPDDVIPARSVAALLRIDDGYRQLAADRAALLAAARAQADEIVAAARSSAAGLEQQARELHADARLRGYEAGREAALADWFAQVADAAQAQRRLHERMRERIAQLVVAAAEQVVAAEPRGALLARAASAVEASVEQASYLHVRVHPDELASAQLEFGRLAERRRAAGAALPLIVSADRLLARGSCLCESDIGTADASLATQLRAMRIAVGRALGAASQAGADLQSQSLSLPQSQSQTLPPPDVPGDGEPGLGALAEKFSGAHDDGDPHAVGTPLRRAEDGDAASETDFDVDNTGPETDTDTYLDADAPAPDPLDDDVEAWMRELAGEAAPAPRNLLPEEAARHA